MTKEQVKEKYWKKIEPGEDGLYSAAHIKRNWKKDKDTNKIKEKDLDDLIKKLNGK